MNFRNRLKDRKTLRTIGLVCLVLAGLSRLFLHPIAGFGSSLIDGTTGLLYGVSIGSLLSSLRTNRQCAPDEA